jgi:CheY-like chemotaxis protein
MARLLIIDDESHITDILVRYFKEKGHESVGATRGEEALALLEASPFDLVITDIAMKGLSGLDLLGKMKQKGLDVPSSSRPAIPRIPRPCKPCGAELSITWSSRSISRRSPSAPKRRFRPSA